MKRRHFLTTAASSLAVVSHATATRPEIATVTLRGSPAEIGNLWGRMNAAAIHADMEKYYLKPSKDAGLSIPTLIARSEKYAQVSRRYAPHWLEETRAVAEAAGVEPDIYLSFTASVYRGLFLDDEWTSYAMSTAFTEDKRIFFHKNRARSAPPPATTRCASCRSLCARGTTRAAANGARTGCLWMPPGRSWRSATTRARSPTPSTRGRRKWKHGWAGS